MLLIYSLCLVVFRYRFCVFLVLLRFSFIIVHVCLQSYHCHITRLSWSFIHIIKNNNSLNTIERSSVAKSTVDLHSVYLCHVTCKGLWCVTYFRPTRELAGMDQTRITQFYLQPPNASSTWLYSPATIHHRLLDDTNCFYTHREMARLSYLVGWLDFSHQQLNLRTRSPIPVLTVMSKEQPPYVTNAIATIRHTATATICCCNFSNSKGTSIGFRVLCVM